MRLNNVSLRARLLRIGAVLLACATAQMLWSNLRRIEHQAHSLGPQISVVIATQDLPVGLVITASDVQIQQLHQSQVPSEVIQSSATAIGAIVRVGLLKGTPLQTGNLQLAQRDANSIVARGYRALRVTDLAGLQPPPGAVVDIIASFADTEDHDVEPHPPASNSRVIARGATVMFDQTTAQHRSAQRHSTDYSQRGVIVRVKERDVTAITFAQSFGTVSIVLAPLENACCD